MSNFKPRTPMCPNYSSCKKVHFDRNICACEQAILQAREEEDMIDDVFPEEIFDDSIDLEDED